MRKNVSALVIIMLFLISCAKTVYYSSDWQSNKITVDGKMSEWSNPLRFYDQESGINYTISNDHQNLYLCCTISNEQMQLKILRSGIEFSIDTLGEKKFPVILKYPYSTSPNQELIRNPNTKPNTSIQPNTNAQSENNIESDFNIPPNSNVQLNSISQPAQGSRGMVDRTAMKLRLLAEKREMQLTGFKPPVGKVISMSDKNKTGISAAVDFDKRGIMCYEAVIPFSTFYKNNLTPSDTNKVFNYRIKINAAPNSGGGQNRGNGSRGGGMRGGMGGEMGGGMGGGMRGGMGGGGMRGMGGGMRGGMGGDMGGGGMYGGSEGEGRQRSGSTSGTTKIETKLKLAYR
jgi:hypothetical protein